MKKKIGFIVLAVVVIAALLFCLIYTRPRTLENIIGIDNDTPTQVFVSTTDYALEENQPQLDLWALTEEQETDPAVCAKVMELLKGTHYRVSLVSLTSPSTVHGNNADGLSGMTNVLLIFDGDRTVSINILGSVVTISFSEADLSGKVIASMVDHSSYKELVDYIYQIGEKN